MRKVVSDICPTEGLGEYVGVLLGRGYVLHRIFSSPEKVANEVVTHVYVFVSGRAQREDTATEHASAGHPRGPRSFDMLPRLGPRAPALECRYLAVPPLSVRFSPRECGNVPSAGAGSVAAAAEDSAAGAVAAGAGDSAAGAVAAGGVR